MPFRTVYIHGLVRDAERQKMSKTKGNVMDPIEIIEKYGTDAVRFTMAAMVAPGGDIAFSESRTESYRAFANKIWNAARFLFMNVDRATEAGLWSLAEFKIVPKFGCPILPRSERVGRRASQVSNPKPWKTAGFSPASTASRRKFTMRSIPSAFTKPRTWSITFSGASSATGIWN